MARSSPYAIKLTEAERSQLETLSRKYTAPYYLVVRAKIVLFAADGMSNDSIGKSLNVGREIVSKWRKRFFEHRMMGLEDNPGRGRSSARSKE